MKEVFKLILRNRKVRLINFQGERMKKWNNQPYKKTPENEFTP